MRRSFRTFTLSTSLQDWGVRVEDLEQHLVQILWQVVGKNFFSLLLCSLASLLPRSGTSVPPLRCNPHKQLRFWVFTLSKSLKEPRWKSYQQMTILFQDKNSLKQLKQQLVLKVGSKMVKRERCLMAHKGRNGSVFVFLTSQNEHLELDE